VVVGHDANIKLLKGGGHPLLSQAERLYMVHSVRYVHQAMISTGHGWMDAEPEIALIKPNFYVVNEDGDKPEKLAFCVEHGIEYVVLKRIPKAGLPKRVSTDLRDSKTGQGTRFEFLGRRSDNRRGRAFPAFRWPLQEFRSTPHKRVRGCETGLMRGHSEVSSSLALPLFTASKSAPQVVPRKYRKGVPKAVSFATVSAAGWRRRMYRKLSTFLMRRRK